MKNTPVKYLIICITSCCLAHTVQAGQNDFTKGKVLPEFGQVAMVEADMLIPKGTTFTVLFDAAEGTSPGSINRTLNTAARFLNMHGEAGVPEENIKLAIVFHGKASFDLTNDDFYSEKFDAVENTNANLIQALKEKGVRLILCGQSAAYHDISKQDLVPGVEMALSAMTAHALLQQDGFTLNPF